MSKQSFALAVAALAAALILAASQLRAQLPLPEGLAEWQQARQSTLRKVVEEFTARIDSGSLDGRGLMDAYRNRGVAYSYLLEYEKAEGDFTRALELDLVNAQLYEDRAITFLKLRRFDAADQDLDMALGLDRKRSAAFREKGRLAAYRGDWPQAVPEFNRALETASGEAVVYSAIWLHMAIRRAELKGPGPLDTLAGTMNDHWPRPVVYMFAGKMGAEDAIGAAAADDFRTTLMQQCEAYFYAGERFLIDGQRDKARAAFEAAVATGVTDFIEYDWAQRELELLSQK